MKILVLALSLNCAVASLSAAAFAIKPDGQQLPPTCTISSQWPSQVVRVAFSPCSKKVALGFFYFRIELAHLAEKKRTVLTKGSFFREDTLCNLEFNDETMLASAESSEKVLIWSLATKKPLLTTTCDGIASTLRFSPNHKLLAIGTSCATHLLNMETKRQRTLQSTNPTSSCAFNADSTQLAVGNIDELHLYDTRSHAHLRSIKFTRGLGCITLVTFDNHDTLVALASNSIKYVLNTKTGKILKSTGPQKSPARSSQILDSFAPEVDYFFHHTIHESHKDLRYMPSKLLTSGSAESFSSNWEFSPHRSVLAVGGNNGSLFLWSTKHILSYPTDADPITSSK